MTPQRTILMIRHGEKPSNDDHGVDEHGDSTSDGLTPKGWTLAGALVTLFAANNLTLTTSLPVPGALVTPKYAQPIHRPYLTLLPLSQRLGQAIVSTHPVDADPAQIVDSLLAIEAAVVLVCWEHHHLVDVVSAFGQAVPSTNPDDVPLAWPDDRFDVIWRFDLDDQTQKWTFTSVNQQLLFGDL